MIQYSLNPVTKFMQFFVSGNVERAPGAEEGDEDENGGRDWLDWFYMTSRAAAVFAFIYFYTTPMRFLFVFCLALLMYL